MDTHHKPPDAPGPAEAGHYAVLRRTLRDLRVLRGFRFFVIFVASSLPGVRVLRGFLIVPFVAAALLAQQQTPPVFRSGVEAVQMDVVVIDKDGKPVTGLTKEDFEIFEQGVPQEITVFAPVNTPI